MTEKQKTLCLGVFSARGERKIFPLDRERLALGREPSCEIHLPDTSVSKRHALIVVTPGGVRIEDGVDGVPSSNGVYVNGVRIDGVAPLGEGDELMVGVFRFTVGDAQEMARVPSLAEIRKAKDIPLYLAQGDFSFVSDAEVVARVTELALTVTEIERMFDDALDDAMGSHQLKRVAFLSRIKRQIIDQGDTPLSIDALQVEKDPTLRIVFVVAGLAAAVVIGMTLLV
ncbi:MAG: FHA domain-containing protein [Nitrospinae bacterium]|nr:FHA domain-containing protein [Nitrospinota bacterium]